MPFDIMTYDVMKYDVMNYDFFTACCLVRFAAFFKSMKGSRSSMNAQDKSLGYIITGDVVT